MLNSVRNISSKILDHLFITVKEDYILAMFPPYVWELFICKSFHDRQ